MRCVATLRLASVTRFTASVDRAISESARSIGQTPGESCEDGAMSDEPRFVDVVNPTPEEIRAWAYSGAFEPMQDWDLVIADVDNVELLLELVGDHECPARDYLLDSLYCLVGHSDRADPRLLRAAEAARTASDAWTATWGRRVCQAVENPSDFNRADWFGLDGYRSKPNG